MLVAFRNQAAKFFLLWWQNKNKVPVKPVTGSNFKKQNAAAKSSNIEIQTYSNENEMRKIDSTSMLFNASISASLFKKGTLWFYFLYGEC